MHLTVGGKIFSIAGVLLALMITAALLSTWLMGRVSADLDLVAEAFVPISGKVAEADVEVLEQELLLERMLRRFDRGEVDTAAIEDEIRRFEELQGHVDRDLNAAIQLAEQSMVMATEDEDIATLTAIQVGLRDIERQHQHFHDGALRVITLKREGRGEVADELLAVLANEEGDFDSAVSLFREDLATYTRDSVDEVDADEHRARNWNATVTGVAMVIGMFFAWLVTRSLVGPVHALVRGLRNVEAGNLEEIEVTSRDEIGQLTSSFNHMIDELRVKQQIKDTFGKYLDPRVVEGILGGAGAAKLTADEGEKHLVSVFFSDIVGFTELGERLTPAGLVRMINAYFELACEPIAEHHGILDKYIGDAVMAFWSPPFVADGDQARLACRATLDQVEQLRTFRQRLPELLGLRRDLPPVDIRIGLATGEALVGNIGSRALKSFTVMGDTVNLGSRLEGVNKVYGTRILMCERTQRMAADTVETREIDAITVAGSERPIQVYELLGHRGGLEPGLDSVRDHYRAGLAAYRDQAWDDAQDAFKAADGAREGGDPPSRVFLRRVAMLRDDPPGDDWDGVWRLNAK
ncbi:MAG: adenylate/guanylate cyclase domain-containing protein [Acidobacteriota bacterium]